MGFSKYNSDPRKFYKTNFVELIELITPEVYQQKDLELSGTELNPISDIINRHIQLANNIGSVISLSGVTNTQTSSLGNISGISQYFVKQNELTNINPYIFESKILNPLGTTLKDYETSAAFNSYLSGTLLPQLVPASQTKPGALEENIATLSALTSNANASSVHNYLVDNLGWFYFLNTSADGGLDYSPSSYVLSSLNSLYVGNNLETVDGVKGLTEYIWRNNETCSFGAYLPTNFVSGTADAVLNASDGIVATYTSGIQKLDALKTLVDVVYSPLYIDQQDYTVKDAFDSFINADLKLDDLISKGSHRKFNNILGFQFADISDEIENLSLIYDIENVRSEHLQYIADLIGFKLRGASPSKWRHQLRLAIDLYKKSGTLEAIQTAINALIVDSVFDVSGKVQELFESYIPNLIWYSIGTESPLFRNLETWTPSLAAQAGIQSYSTSSLEDNLKIVTDSILLDLYKAFPENFLFNGKPFSVPEFYIVDNDGNEVERYTIIGDPTMKPFHIHGINDSSFASLKLSAKINGESNAFDAAVADGPLGEGVYMAGISHPDGERPIYLKFKGDLEFLFNYRGKNNYPMPPFEEVKYYRDSSVTKPMVDLLVERLKCFQVREDFADQVGNFIVSSAVTDDSDLGTLNEFLMFFSSVQTPSNFNDVMLSISDYEKNLLPLWNGKSSHLFVNFDSADFDFAKTTLEGDGKYALYEAARTAREFSPAHAITRVNLTASAEDLFEASSTRMEYLGLDHDDTRASYTSASIFGNFEYSGVSMSTGSQTAFTKALRFNGANQFASAVNGVDPRTHPFSIDIADGGNDFLANPGFTASSDGVTGRVNPYACGIVFKYTGTGAHQTIVANCGRSTSVGVLLPEVYVNGATDALYFQIGSFNRTTEAETVNRKNLGTLSKDTWYGLYFDYNGARESAASEHTEAFLDSAYRFKFVNLGTGAVTDVADGWDSVGVDIPILAETLCFGATVLRPGAGGTEIKYHFEGEIASFSLNTLLLETALPTDAEASLIVRDPIRWLNEYRIGQNYRKLAAQTATSNYQLDATGNLTGGASILHQFGDNANDTTSLIDNYTALNTRVNLNTVNMASDSIATIAIPGIEGESNKFRRTDVDNIRDYLISSTTTVTPLESVARRALRRRNLKYLLPHEGYYDRTGFNGPVSYDPSTLEESMPSSLGELTLGYVASAGKFHPVVDPVSPSGVWDICENLDSSRSFSSIDTSNTFPYRGLSALGSVARDPNASATARYVDRGQLPELYNTMHKVFEAKALFNASLILSSTSAYDVNSYWKNNDQSLANEAIASGLVLNSFADYENFSFGTGLHKVHRDYCKYFAKHPLGLTEVEKTGANIFAHVFGLGLYNCDLKLDGAQVGNFVASSVDSVTPINSTNVWKEAGAGTYIASATREGVVPLSGTFTPGNVNNAELRNPEILSGIEFCDISGAPSQNQFSIFDLDPTFKVPGLENYLIGNRVIKCKSQGGLPRIRFDLSSYGDRRNRFIKDHQFELKIKSLVAEEYSNDLGGGKLGVWIHTDASGGGEDGLIWSWTPNGKWEPIRENRISRDVVTDVLAHIYDFRFKKPDKEEEVFCLGNITKRETVINNVSLGNIKESYFETFSINFDTRNFTDQNGFEYLKIIPIEESEYIITEQVNMDSTNYIVEIFFLPNLNPDKYLLIDSIELQDKTLRDRAGIGTGYGVVSKGTPLRPFVNETKLELSKDQLKDVLKFYNGLIGQGTGVYATNLASRDATITSGVLEVSGGSRLNYRMHPDWTNHSKDATYENYTDVEFNN